ncbi:MAG: SRPBCC family protein [Planctomycetes bacterium]|nr:SRPBCC family protein [Planctomycetota bacterium]
MTDKVEHTGNDYKPQHVIRVVELGAPAAKVWEVVGGFYTIQEWHPDITVIEIPAEQTHTRQLRRHLTFPGQPITTEELVSMDNDDFHYRYKWYQGPWGEAVKNYKASLRVFSGDLDKTCFVQWESTFDYPSDAISDFYWNGFRELQKRFPLK